VQEAVRRLREAVLAGDEQRRTRLGRELGAVLLPAALRDELAASAGTHPARLCFLLHGPLEALPIEALEDGAWFTETIVPVVLPGLPGSAPEAAWEPSLVAHWQLLGDPCGTEGEALLPGARAELEDLAQLHPDARIARSTKFDREKLASALSSGECLHIATHVGRGGGSDSLRTDRARFVLSNGAEFELHEVAQLAPHAPLIVLTGCETGGGRFHDALGLQGLARAFLEGGTRNLVATSWPVEDRWARACALALHRALAAGFSPSRACAEARRSLRAQGAPCSEWAAFRLLGQD
jgi:CHAT domain-containing protein